MSPYATADTRISEGEFMLMRTKLERELTRLIVYNVLAYSVPYRFNIPLVIV